MINIINSTQKTKTPASRAPVYFYVQILKGGQKVKNRVKKQLSALLYIWWRIVLPLNVAMQYDGLCTRKTALTTFVGFYSSVYALVCFQITSCSCRIVTHVTFERFFSSVQPSVCYE